MPTLFNPRATLPAYPEHKIAEQLQRRAALPSREIVQRRVFICSASNPSRDTIDHARAAALRAHKLASTGWTVIVVRDDGIAAELVKVCEQYEISCEVVSSHRAALKQADKIVSFDRVDILRQAYRLRIPIYYNGLAIPAQMVLL